MLRARGDRVVLGYSVAAREAKVLITRIEVGVVVVLRDIPETAASEVVRLVK